MAIIQDAYFVGKISYSLVYFMIQNCLEEFQRITSFYRTRVRSLALLVTNSLTDCRLGNLIDVVTVIDVDDEK